MNAVHTEVVFERTRDVTAARLFKVRGLAGPPELAVGGGALGFWKALDEVFPGTRHQHCWFHKVSNILNHFPKAMQPAV